MNESLNYRSSLVNAKKAWDKIGNNPDKKKVIEDEGCIARDIIEKQKALEIFGGGVAILSKAEGKPILLYSPDVQRYFGIKDDMHEYEFLNTPYNLPGIESGFENFIDLLFFVSRDTKYPEYVKNIHAEIKSQFEYNFQYLLRNKYEILHCSAGEVLFFSLLWRLIIELVIKSNDLNTIYNNSLFQSTKYDPKWFSIFLDSKESLDEKVLIQKISREADTDQKAIDENNLQIHRSVMEAKDYFLDSIKCDLPIKYIFEQLGLFNAEALKQLNVYTQFVFPDKTIFLTEQNCEDFADQIIDAFAEEIGVECSETSLMNFLVALHAKARFPILPYYFLNLFDKNKELKEHVVFPLWYTFSPDTKYEYKKGEYESAVLHALYTIKPIWNVSRYRYKGWYTAEDENIHPDFENYLNELCELFTSLSAPIIDKEYYAEESKKNTDLVIRQATRSAISQYMCRNLSHNLGSHSIPQFNLLLDRMISSKRDENYWSNDKLYQIQGFNEYMQGRMEFLAEFSSNAFSELYIEYSFSEICQELYTSIKFLEGQPGSGEYEIVFKGMIDSFASDHMDIEINEIPDENEKVDIRGDNLGIQAFYIIIENVIRNLYKHSNKPILDNKPTIIFDIKISEEISDPEVAANYFAIDIVDKHGKVNDEKWKATSEAQSVVGHINKLIQQRILNPEDNTLREEGWGLLEMKSAAAYLSGMPDYAIDTPYKSFRDSQNPLKEHIVIDGITFPYPLKASFYPDKISQNNIAYRFYLPRTKFCLIDRPAPENVAELKEVGIDFGNKEGGRHKFFVTDNNVLDGSSNQRSLEAIDFEDIINKLNLRNEAQFKDKVWSKYLDKFPGLGDKQIYYASESSPKVISDAQQAIVFDVHGRNVTVNRLSSKNFTIKDILPGNAALSPLDNSSLFYFYESFPSRSKLPISIDPSTQPYCSMLKEAAGIKVAIFDERLQAYSESLDSDQPNLTNRQILFTSGVYIPSIEAINLLSMAKSPTPEVKKTFIEQLKAYIEVSDFIIVHFTLLEVYIGVTGKNEIENWLKMFIAENQLVEKNKILVLISGRGKPSNLPKGFYFANYTIIADCVSSTRSKLRLVTILKSLRK